MTRFREEVYATRWYKAALKAKKAQLPPSEDEREAWWRSIRYINHGKSRKANPTSVAQGRLDAF